MELSRKLTDGLLSAAYSNAANVGVPYMAVVKARSQSGCFMGDTDVEIFEKGVSIDLDGETASLDDVKAAANQHGDLVALYKIPSSFSGGDSVTDAVLEEAFIDLTQA